MWLLRGHLFFVGFAHFGLAKLLWFGDAGERHGATICRPRLHKAKHIAMMTDILRNVQRNSLDICMFFCILFHDILLRRNNMQLENLDKRDRQILNLLQDNGRLSNAELAEKVSLSPSACLRRVKQLEESGLIAGYHMQLDMKACGMSGAAFVFVTLDSQGRETLARFERAIRTINEIQDCYLLAGEYDYMLRIIYRDAADLERIHHDILTNLPGVVRVNSTLTLRAVKHTGKLEV